MKRFIFLILIIMSSGSIASGKTIKTAAIRVGWQALTYNGGTASLYANFDLLICDRWHYDDFSGASWNTLKAINPNIKIFLYQHSFEVDDDDDSITALSLNNISRWSDGDGDYGSRGHSMGDINTDNSDLLLTYSGSRVQFTSDGMYLGDFGSSDFVDYWVEATNTDIISQAWKADGIFLDNAFCTLITPYFGTNPFSPGTPDSYSTPTAWENAMAGYTSAISGQLSSLSQLTIVNRGYSRFDSCATAWATLDSEATPPFAALEEGFAVTGDGVGDVFFFAESQWLNQIGVINGLDNYGVVTNSGSSVAVNGSGTDNYGDSVGYWDIVYYTLSSFLVAQNGNDYYYYNASGYNYSTYYDDYDIDIGDPVSATYSSMSSGSATVYYREYDNGYVFVNPGTSNSSSFSLLENCKNITHTTLTTYTTDSNISTLQLNAHRGAILYKTASLYPSNLPAKMQNLTISNGTFYPGGK